MSDADVSGLLAAVTAAEQEHARALAAREAAGFAYAEARRAEMHASSVAEEAWRTLRAQLGAISA